jgi:hypothetical protein
MTDRKSFDPTENPHIPREDFVEGHRLGLVPIIVHCHGDDEVSGVSFSAHVYAIPRIGERIVLQNGATAEVTRVYHNAFQGGDSGFYSFAVNISAQLLRESDESEDPYGK